MIIKHNINAVNASHALENNNKNVSQSIKKLSSGCKINSAADDAAGLTISQKMKSQIQGLQQGTKNSQDGISLLQTAEGGMSEIQSILQRCKELAIQSANGTNNDEDRTAMQNEIDQLMKEVESISNNTKFNSLSLLNGKYDKDGNAVDSGALKDCVNYVTTTGGVTDKYTYGGKQYASGVIDFSNINSAADIANLVGKGFSYTCCTCNKNYSIKFVSGTPDTSRLNDSNPVMEVDVSSITSGTDLVKKIIETAYGQANFVYNPTSTSINGGIPVSGTDVPSGATSFVDHYSQLASDGAKLYIYDDRPENANGSWPSTGSGEFNLNVYGEASTDVDKFLYLNIQSGSNDLDTIRMRIPNTTIDELGINGLSVDLQKNAILAIPKIDNAIDKVSASRAMVGAYQNRIIHTINVVNNTYENLQNAKSKITDADMAKEAMGMSKNSILQQSAQGMLAQANKMPQSILDLMKQWG